MSKKKVTWIIINIFLIASIAYAAVTDSLILQDIGSYKFITQRKNPATKQMKTTPGYAEWKGPGILGGAGHFGLDHSDTTYETEYESDIADLGVEVQVTQHAGTDFDRWLLHEVEDGYRDPDILEAKPTEGTMIRELNGNKIFFYGGGVVDYRWVSNNIVVNIQYTNLSGPKPEPLEVIRAYLQKHPSTIPTTLVLDRAHDEQWIKDEMDRRLWLGDKWFLQTQTGKVETNKVLKEAIDHIGVFLDYRQKYYGVAAKEEKKALSGFQLKQDGAAIKKKLAGYKTWWEANKGRAISLP